MCGKNANKKRSPGLRSAGSIYAELRRLVNQNKTVKGHFPVSAYVRQLFQFRSSDSALLQPVIFFAEQSKFPGIKHHGKCTLLTLTYTNAIIKYWVKLVQTKGENP